MSYKELGIWIFGGVVALGVTISPKEYSPGETYYVSNNWDKVEYKTVFMEEEANQNLEYKLEEPPTTFSSPNDFLTQTVNLQKGKYFPLPFNSEDIFTADLDNGIFTAEKDIKVYAPFDSKVVDVYPNVKSGVVSDVHQIYNSSNGVTLTIVSDQPYEIGDSQPMYIKIKLSSLSRTYASEKHSPLNAYSSIKDEYLKIYYTDFSDTGKVPASKGALLGRFGKTGNIPNKNIKEYKNYCRVEVYKSKSNNTNDWVKIPFSTIYGKED